MFRIYGVSPSEWNGGFAYLKRLPVSYLKIDREFVQDIWHRDLGQHVVSAVVNPATAFGMRTVAEGAEDNATVEPLQNPGASYSWVTSLVVPHLRESHSTNNEPTN